MTARQPPRLVVSGLTGRIYVTTSYTEHRDGMIESRTKFDVTDDFEAIVKADYVPRSSLTTRTDTPAPAVNKHPQAPPPNPAWPPALAAGLTGDEDVPS